MGAIADIGGLPFWKNKWFWIILVILIAAYFIYKWGGNAIKSSITQASLTGGNAALPPSSDWQASTLGEALNTDLNGWFGNGNTLVADITALAQLPTDTMIQAVYNYYNSKYQTANGNKTLTQAIASQWSLLPNFMTGLGDAQTLAANALAHAGCP